MGVTFNLVDQGVTRTGVYCHITDVSGPKKNPLISDGTDIRIQQLNLLSVGVKYQVTVDIKTVSSLTTEGVISTGGSTIPLANIPITVTGP